MSFGFEGATIRRFGTIWYKIKLMDVRWRMSLSRILASMDGFVMIIDVTAPRLAFVTAMSAGDGD
jgi:hypothetical protein